MKPSSVLRVEGLSAQDRAEGMPGAPGVLFGGWGWGGITVISSQAHNGLI